MNKLAMITFSWYEDTLIGTYFTDNEIMPYFTIITILN